MWKGIWKSIYDSDDFSRKWKREVSEEPASMVKSSQSDSSSPPRFYGFKDRCMKQNKPEDYIDKFSRLSGIILCVGLTIVIISSPIWGTGVTLYFIYKFRLTFIAISCLISFLALPWLNRFRKKNRDWRKITETRSTPSYKLEVVIRPYWDTIIEKLMQEHSFRKGGLDLKCIDDYREEFLREKGYSGPISALHGFRFIKFFNNTSNMKQIWSDHSKTFVDDFSICNYPFPGFNISPDCCGYGHDMRHFEGSPLDKKELAWMPFSSIMLLIKDMGIYLGESMIAVKKFPEEIQKSLEASKTNYYFNSKYGCKSLGELKELKLEGDGMRKRADILDIKLYDEQVQYHIFYNDFYEILLRIVLFEKL